MRHILITGTRKGIGQYLAIEYLKQGDVVFGCSRGQTSIEHENYYHFTCDVTIEKEVNSMVKKIRKDFKTIDVLINNAGIALMNHSILTPGSGLEKVFATNVFGTFYFSREVAKLMSRNKKGSIVNFSTVASPLDLAGEAIYAASKAAVEKLTTILAKEFGEFGVRVNCIGPSPIKTDLIKNVGEEKLNDLLAQQAIKEFGDLSDVKNVIDFFISESSKQITGQKIYLGGVF